MAVFQPCIAARAYADVVGRGEQLKNKNITYRCTKNKYKSVMQTPTPTPNGPAIVNLWLRHIWAHSSLSIMVEGEPVVEKIRSISWTVGTERMLLHSTLECNPPRCYPAVVTIPHYRCCHINIWGEGILHRVICSQPGRCRMDPHNNQDLDPGRTLLKRTRPTRG